MYWAGVNRTVLLQTRENRPTKIKSCAIRACMFGQTASLFLIIKGFFSGIRCFVIDRTLRPTFAAKNKIAIEIRTRWIEPSMALLL